MRRSLFKKQVNRFILVWAMAVMLVFQTFCHVPVQAASAKTLDPTVDTVLTNVKNYILSVDTDPGYSSIWNAIGLKRSGLSVSDDWYKTYYNNTVNYLEDQDWNITRAKYSEYSKLILGMTVIGKNAENIAGHNLLSYLSDFSKIKLQGFNGPVWALIALNSHPSYEIPIDVGAKEQTTEEGLISYILGRELSGGGWTLFGSKADTDITGMTIQALAPYYGSREDITAAVDRALEWLAGAQNSKGGYSTLNGSTTTETSESDAQVIVALCSLGIDPMTDSRFVQADGSWVMSRLFDYYISAGTDKAGFMHVLAGSDNNGGGVAGTLNGMATEQGFYATAAYRRLLDGNTSLYNMSDIELTDGEKPDSSSKKTTEEETTTASKVKVTKVSLDYKKITLNVGKTKKLKATVSPKNASNKKIKWKSSNKKIAKVTQAGKVKGLKAGRVTITAAARDGSGRKATCKVVVKKKKTTKIKVSSVSLNYSQISVAAGASRTLSASVTPSNATNKSVRWYSSDSSVASVSQSGTVNGKSNGTATITVKAKDGSGAKATCKVIVYGGSSSSTSSGQTSSQQTVSNAQNGGGQGSGGKGSSDSGDEDPEETTEVDAWSFDGDSFVPDEAEEEDGEEDTLDDAMETGDQEADSTGADNGLNLPRWLQILLGFGSSGFLAGGIRVPWEVLLERLRKLRG